MLDRFKDCRIAVTGMGAVSALGHTLGENWTAARDGRSGIEIRAIDAGRHGPTLQSFPVALVAPGVQESIEASLGRRVGALDPFALYALKAVHEALTAAKLLNDPILETRTAAFFGHGFCGTNTLERGYERFYGMKSARLHPLILPRIMVSAPVSAISMEFGIRGPAVALSSACSSSGHAIAYGALMVASGLCDVAIVGGSEAMITPGGMGCWSALQAISTSTCRPFSAGRDGTVLGDGAAALVLESFAHASGRGVPILGELRGIGMSSDAHHWTQPSPDGAVAAISQACESAGVVNMDELLISAHGTGTLLNDKNEAAALRKVFGGRERSHHVIATKSAHGHLIGASTALQAVLGLMALATGMAPPVLNYLGEDPECDLNLVLDRARPIGSSHLLVNSFAFGGLNTALVFRK